LFNRLRMKSHSQILVSRIALAACMAASLYGCGQQGPLYLPTEPAAANRATLPETLRPGFPSTPSTPPPKPVTAASAAN
jgi:predicted small lipoprotein YifL